MLSSGQKPSYEGKIAEFGHKQGKGFGKRAAQPGSAISGNFASDALPETASHLC